MKKNVLGIIAGGVLVGFALSCSGVKNTERDEDSVDSLESVEADSALCDDTTAVKRSLNDIRFDSFTDKDWVDNEYIKALRDYLDTFNNGWVENEELDPYREDVKGKFVVYNVEPFIVGGLYIQVVFIDKPENIFTAWVYSGVDEEKEVVVDYSVRRVSLDEMKNDMSREEILQEMKKRPELKLW